MGKKAAGKSDIDPRNLTSRLQPFLPAILSIVVPQGGTKLEALATAGLLRPNQTSSRPAVSIDSLLIG